MSILKKILSLTVAVSIFTTLSVNLLANPSSSHSLLNLKQITVSENNQSLYQIQVDPYNPQRLEEIISFYDVMPETAQAMRNYS